MERAAASFGCTGDHLILSSTDKDLMIEAAREAFHPMDVEFGSASQEVRFDISGSRLDACELIWQTLAHTQRVIVHGEPSGDSYLVQVHLGGAAEVRYGRDAVEVLPGRRGVITSVTEPTTWRSDSTYDEIALSIPRRRLERQFESVFGVAVGEPVEFGPALRFEAGAVALVADQLEVMHRLVARGGEDATQLPVWSALEEAVLNCLLIHQRHNYDWLVRREPRSAGIRAVRAAERFIEAKASDPITIADIASAAGVSQRSLQRAFREHRASTPTRSLRNRRLDRARALLQTPSIGVSVTDVAALCQFAHLGQFGVEYRKRFGESPSETLRGSRRG